MTFLSLTSRRREAVGGDRSTRSLGVGPRFPHLSNETIELDGLSGDSEKSAPTPRSLSRPATGAGSPAAPPARRSQLARLVWPAQCWRIIKPTFKHGQTSHFSNAKCAASFGTWEAQRPLGPRSHRATAVPRGGRPPRSGRTRAVRPAAVPAAPHGPPPVHVPVSFMCPTLAEIRAGEPVLRGPGWQPLADLQTRERWPHAAHGFLSAVQLPLGKAG